MNRVRARALGALVCVVVLVGACTGAEANRNPRTHGSEGVGRDRPIPAPVPVATTPSQPLADPTFDALPGATAYSGALGAAVYRIEIPKQWNGVLVMWMHGFGELRSTARVDAPDFRRFLIDHRIAWAASSFSSTSMIPSIAADETAALWDRFVVEFGRPRVTLVTGLSMGGWATHIAAARYGNRYDGALALCGAAGPESGMRVSTDQLVTAAYVAGLTQVDVDAATDLGALFENRVRRALDDPQTFDRFVELTIALTGGARRYARDGIVQEFETNWERAMLLLGAGLTPERAEPFTLVGMSRAEETRFNAAVVHLPADLLARSEFLAGTEVTGDLQMPLLTLHSTGDGQVPIGQALVLRDAVRRAGRSADLAQWVIEDSGHCGFTTAEQERAVTALLRWVRRGVRPAATDLDNRDLRRLDRTFELQPRRTRARDTVHVGGRATLDGRPLVADFVGAVVRDDGLITPCQTEIPAVRDGRISLRVLTAAAAAGCARGGSQIVLWTYSGDRQIFAPGLSVRTLADLDDVAVEFSTADPRPDVPLTSDLHGEVFDASGTRISRGRLEARISGHLCGLASVRHQGSFNGYILSIRRDPADGQCAEGAEVHFTLDRHAIGRTIRNVDQGREAIDLTLR